MYRPDKAMIRETDSVHVYVMTSPDNDEETRKQFKEHRILFEFIYIYIFFFL